VEDSSLSEIPREILDAYDATNCLVVTYRRKRRLGSILVSVADTNGLFLAEKRFWRRSKALKFIDESLGLYDDLLKVWSDHETLAYALS